MDSTVAKRGVAMTKFNGVSLRGYRTVAHSHMTHNPAMGPKVPLARTVVPSMSDASSDKAVKGGIKGWFAKSDVQLIERSEEAVEAFHEKERIRWDKVYDEVYTKGQYGELEFYPGDRVKVVGDVEVKDIKNAKGMEGVVTNFDFDDGYESCQSCESSFPVTVLLDPA